MTDLTLILDTLREETSPNSVIQKDVQRSLRKRIALITQHLEVQPSFSVLLLYPLHLLVWDMKACELLPSSIHKGHTQSITHSCLSRNSSHLSFSLPLDTEMLCLALVSFQGGCHMCMLTTKAPLEKLAWKGGGGTASAVSICCPGHQNQEHPKSGPYAPWDMKREVIGFSPLWSFLCLSNCHTSLQGTPGFH